jgi:hypothetical protein
MGIRAGKIDPHWNYFLAIERDLETLARFVEFNEDNFKCFSIEMARLLLAAAAEVDIVCKQLCRKMNAASKAEKIGHYRREIVTEFPTFGRRLVLIPRFELTLQPWSAWTDPDPRGAPPLWWTAYNKTKHERATEFTRANLHNTLNAVAGLYLALLHLHREKAEMSELTPSPVMLRPHQDYYRGISNHAFELSYAYDLS